MEGSGGERKDEGEWADDVLAVAASDDRGAARHGDAGALTSARKRSGLPHMEAAAGAASSVAETARRKRALVAMVQQKKRVKIPFSPRRAFLLLRGALDFAVMRYDRSACKTASSREILERA